MCDVSFGGNVCALSRTNSKNLNFKSDVMGEVTSDVIEYITSFRRAVL